MRLYLLRHAEAAPYQSDDFSRRLTGEGIGQAKRVGEFLANHGIHPELILTSPVLRAKETAEIVTAKLGRVDPTLASWLACGMTPQTALHELADYKHVESVLIVGHEPDFSSLVAFLLGIESSSAVEITKASLTAMDISRLAAGFGVLKFLLPVRVL